MFNRKYGFELRAASSVEIFDYADGHEIVRLDDAHVKDFLLWYFDGPVPGTSMQIIPEVKALVDALSELADLMDDIVAGEYTPDTFTTQPAHAALAAFTPALACGASEVPE